MPFAALGQSSFPDYEAVVIKFFEEYSLREMPSDTRLHFEKRPTGWHVRLSIYGQEDAFKNEIFWNSNDESYKSLDFPIPKSIEENIEMRNEFFNDWQKRYFRICPYYGYPGWDWEVIRDFGDSKDLPDTTLYGLGRAYSSFASNLLHNNTGLADPQFSFDLADGKNSLSDIQLEKYRYYRHKAIEQFELLAKRAPSFNTIVGSIATKAYNEYLTSFLDLRIYQNEKEAQKEIRDGLYSDFYISLAKNYLNSCPENAILFTNGDNDTYPLLYVQSQYGIRRDVLVVNLSLLFTSRYINSLREPILEASPMPLSFTPEQISGKQREIIVVGDERDEPIEIADLIALLKVDENMHQYGPSRFHVTPTNKFELSSGENTSIFWEIDRPYFLRGQLMILDMLATNNWERPVCFAITMAEDSYFGLNDYLNLEGLVYRLGKSNKDYADGEIGTVNTWVMYDNLFNHFDWTGMSDLKSNTKLNGINYRVIFHRLAEAYVNVDQPDSAAMVLDKLVDILPDEHLPYGLQMVRIMEDYYTIGAFEKGNEIAKTLIYNFENGVDLYSDLITRDREDKSGEALDRVREIAEEYGQTENLKR